MLVKHNKTNLFAIQCFCVYIHKLDVKLVQAQTNISTEQAALYAMQSRIFQMVQFKCII